MCMGNQSDVVSRHLSQANDLHDTVADVNTRLSDMSQAFDARNPRVCNCSCCMQDELGQC
jgi:hypothetical protein